MAKPLHQYSCRMLRFVYGTTLQYIYYQNWPWYKNGNCRELKVLNQHWGKKRRVSSLLWLPARLSLFDASFFLTRPVWWFCRTYCHYSATCIFFCKKPPGEVEVRSLLVFECSSASSNFPNDFIDFTCEIFDLKVSIQISPHCCCLLQCCMFLFLVSKFYRRTFWVSQVGQNLQHITQWWNHYFQVRS